MNVDEPNHAVIPGDVVMPCEEFEVGADDENPKFQRVPEQLSEENPSVEPQLQSPQSSEPHSDYLHEDESPLNSSGETCA